MHLSSSIACITLSLSIMGCSALERKAAVPAQALSKAQISGLPSVRYLISTQAGVDALVDDVIQVEAARGKKGFTGDANYLALSGGGDDGAFGAGLLVGWSKQGSRPSFNLVTGISTGALIAPFAYLGKDYDPILQQVYTSIKPSASDCYCLTASWICSSGGTRICNCCHSNSNACQLTTVAKKVIASYIARAHADRITTGTD